MPANYVRIYGHFIDMNMYTGQHVLGVKSRLREHGVKIRSESTKLPIYKQFHGQHGKYLTQSVVFVGFNFKLDNNDSLNNFETAIINAMKMFNSKHFHNISQIPFVKSDFLGDQKLLGLSLLHMLCFRTPDEVVLLDRTTNVLHNLV